MARKPRTDVEAKAIPLHGKSVRSATALIDPAISYDGSSVIYRLLRLSSWGAALMNLGYYTFCGPWSVVNLFTSIEAKVFWAMLPHLKDPEVGSRWLHSWFTNEGVRAAKFVDLRQEQR
jgi:hypothetical protein